MFPACDAVMEHDPAVSRLISKPLTVHTAVVVDVSVTGRPELAVGAVVTGVWSKVLLPGLVNVMVWVAWETANERVTGFAARRSRYRPGSR